MGYDINCYLELKTVNDKWHGFGDTKTRVNCNFTAIPVYNKIWITRNYELFGVLSGIQPTEGMPIMFPKPRGLPNNLSNELKSTFYSIEEYMNRYIEDKNSPNIWKIKNQEGLSYVTYEELNQFVNKHPKTATIIDAFKKEISKDQAVNYMADYNKHNELTWDSIPDNRKRIIFFYDC